MTSPCPFCNLDSSRIAFRNQVGVDEGETEQVKQRVADKMALLRQRDRKLRPTGK